MLHPADLSAAKEDAAHVLFEGESREPGPADSVVLRDFWTFVHDRLLPQLPPDQAEIFSQHHFEGLTLSEVGRTLDGVSRHPESLVAPV